MSDRRNVVVGLFVLVGLILLGTLIVWFEGMAILIRGGYIVAGHLPSAVGIRPGKRIHMDGVEIGDVREVVSSQPERAGVWVRMRVNPEVRIPRNAAFVAQQSTVGDLFLDFRTTEQVTTYLPTDGSASVSGVVTPPSLLPEDLMKDFREAMSKFGRLDVILANLKELTEPRTLKDVEAGRPSNLWTTLEQFEVTAKTVNDQLKDPESEFVKLLATARAGAEELRKTLAKVGETLDGANKALATVNEAGKTFQDAGKKGAAALDKSAELMDKLAKDAEQAKALMDNLNGLVADIRGGRGTLGKLVTDDELHRALVLLAENLRTTTDNANRLLTMWREEGILSKEK